jgi:hypothetical protein
LAPAFPTRASAGSRLKPGYASQVPACGLQFGNVGAIGIGGGLDARLTPAQPSARIRRLPRPQDKYSPPLRGGLYHMLDEALPPILV